MTININLYIKVKFRAFYITFGTVDLQGRLECDVTNGKIKWFEETNAPVPSDAWTLFDGRGIVFKAWI